MPKRTFVVMSGPDEFKDYIHATLGTRHLSLTAKRIDIEDEEDWAGFSFHIQSFNTNPNDFFVDVIIEGEQPQKARIYVTDTVWFDVD